MLKLKKLILQHLIINQKNLKKLLVIFDFSKKEIKTMTNEIIKMNNKDILIFSNEFYSIEIKKSKMTQNKIDKLPEFNGLPF